MCRAMCPRGTVLVLLALAVVVLDRKTSSCMCRTACDGTILMLLIALTTTYSIFTTAMTANSHSQKLMSEHGRPEACMLRNSLLATGQYQSGH